MRLSLLVLSAASLASYAAHADTIVTEQLTGTFQSGSILGGSIQVDTTNGTVVGGDPTVTTAGITDSYATLVNQYVGGQVYIVNFQDALTNDLNLSVPGTSFSTPSQLCTVANECGNVASGIEFAGGEPEDFLATTATPVSATPEPSSLILLGSGIVGAAGVLRRKLS